MRTPVSAAFAALVILVVAVGCGDWDDTTRPTSTTRVGLSAIAGPPYDEIIVFDSTNEDSESHEGLARQRLGLTTADGEMEKDGEGNLPPLLSDGMTKAAFDMKGGKGTSLEEALSQLKADGGTLTIITHGDPGVIVIDGKKRAGFGEGTNAECGGPPVQLDGAGAKTNVTVNLAVCKADATAPGVSKVSDSLKAEIEANGGSVSTMVASDEKVKVGTSHTARAVGAVTPEEVAEIQELIADTNLRGMSFTERYEYVKQLFDDAIGPGKVVPVLNYLANIGSTVVEAPTVFETFTEQSSLDGTCDSCPVVFNHYRIRVEPPTDLNIDGPLR